MYVCMRFEIHLVQFSSTGEFQVAEVKVKKVFFFLRHKSEEGIITVISIIVNININSNIIIITI